MVAPEVVNRGARWRKDVDVVIIRVGRVGNRIDDQLAARLQMRVEIGSQRRAQDSRLDQVNPVDHDDGVVQA